jgi:hypothetical protein
MEDKTVTLFRQYLQLKTVQPEPDYGNKKNNSLCSFNTFCLMLSKK